MELDLSRLDRRRHFENVVDALSHGDGSLQGAGRRAREHAVEGTNCRPKLARSDHAFMGQVRSTTSRRSLLGERVAPNLDRSHRRFV